MGGRGAVSSAGRGATSVTVQSGDTIDLRGMPLKYGGLDRAINAEQRKALDAFETKHLKSKVEYALMLGADGEELYTKRGGKGSVKFSIPIANKSDIITHNHPRSGNEAGLLGGTFSQADINAFTHTNVKTMRASAAEGAYSITKSANFNSSGLRVHAMRVQDSASKQYRETVKKAHDREMAAATSGKKTVAEANAAYQAAKTSAFNQKLVTLHNGFIEGQKKYGYTYTLERRK